MTTPATPALRRRVAVIGDVGGHLEALRAELVRLGADPADGRLPDDLLVIQVGDLIHRGPDSAGVVALVDGYLDRQPGHWIQLVGNHEAQYLRTPAFEWPEQLGSDAIATMRRWWLEGQMIAAVSIDAGDERFLITHAGLTSGFWHKVLDGVGDPVLAAAALNSFIGTHEDVLFHAGHMLSSRRPDPLAGPIWAAAGSELVPSWLVGVLPFSQIHGHTSIGPRPRRSRPAVPARTARPARPGWRATVADEVARRTTIDAVSRHETTVLPGGRIIGIDPGHGRRAQAQWRALEL